MEIYSEVNAKKGLPFLYSVILPIAAIIVLCFRQYRQLADFTFWYLFPVWIVAAHAATGFSFLITTFSLKKACSFLKNSYLVYGKAGSLAHLQVALLTSLLEELIFRYLLLSLFLAWLHNPLVSCLLVSLLFTMYHLRYGLALQNLMKYLDLFLFSMLISSLNLLTGSFYPAFIMHWMRNYLLKIMLITKNQA